MQLKLSNRRGSIVALAAVSMLAVLAVMAVVLDGGLLQDRKRSVQAAADAAALAAAADLWENYATNSGADPGGTARASALRTAAANGYNNDGTTNTVTININPLSGDFVGVRGYAEVIISLNQARGFSRIWGQASIPVSARAVAGGTPGDIAILMLNAHETVAAQIGNNVNIQNNGQIYINSDGTVYGEFKADHGMNAIYVESDGHLTTGGINTVGSLFIEAGGSVTYTGGGGLTTGMTPVGDPYGDIPEPSSAGATNYGNKTYNVASTMLPGKYNSITINKNITVTMSPGVYFISGGSLTMKDGARLVGTGVMLYDMPNDWADVPLTASINLSAPTSGTYRGISVFEPRVNGKEIHIKPSGNYTMTGALYSQTGEFDLRPQTAGTVMSFGAYIADLAEWQPEGGTAGLGTININPSTSAPTKRPLLVQ